jgi:transposase-like protein
MSAGDCECVLTPKPDSQYGVPWVCKLCGRAFVDEDLSTGAVPTTVTAMARDAIAFLDAIGLG